LTIQMKHIVGFKIDDLHIEYKGIGFDFMDDPRKNRIKFEKIVAGARTLLLDRQIIDKEEARN